MHRYGIITTCALSLLACDAQRVTNNTTNAKEHRGLIAGIADVRAVDSVAYGLAVSLRLEEHRRYTRDVLRDSRAADHKVALSTFVSAPGAAQLTSAAAQAVGMSAEVFRALVNRAGPLELFMPRREDRLKWEPSVELLVGSAQRGDQATVIAYNSAGQSHTVDRASVRTSMLLVQPLSRLATRFNPQAAGVGATIQSAADGEFSAFHVSVDRDGDTTYTDLAAAGVTLTEHDRSGHEQRARDSQRYNADGTALTAPDARGSYLLSYTMRGFPTSYNYFLSSSYPMIIRAGIAREGSPTVWFASWYLLNVPNHQEFDAFTVSPAFLLSDGRPRQGSNDFLTTRVGLTDVSPGTPECPLAGWSWLTRGARQGRSRTDRCPGVADVYVDWQPDFGSFARVDVSANPSWISVGASSVVTATPRNAWNVAMPNPVTWTARGTFSSMTFSNCSAGNQTCTAVDTWVVPPLWMTNDDKTVTATVGTVSGSATIRVFY